MLLEIPSITHLDEKFTYNPETGVVTWKNSYWKKRIGQRAGCVKRGRSNKSYRFLFIDGQRYLEHRIIWKLYYREDPPENLQIDHINGDGTDNRIINLRLVTYSENGFNREYACSQTKRRGVSLNRDGSQGKRWRARIGNTTLGYYATFEEACEAREKAEANIQEYLPKV